MLGLTGSWCRRMALQQGIKVVAFMLELTEKSARTVKDVLASYICSADQDMAALWHTVEVLSLKSSSCMHRLHLSDPARMR